MSNMPQRVGTPHPRAETQRVNHSPDRSRQRHQSNRTITRQTSNARHGHEYTHAHAHAHEHTHMCTRAVCARGLGVRTEAQGQSHTPGPSIRRLILSHSLALRGLLDCANTHKISSSNLGSATHLRAPRTCSRKPTNAQKTYQQTQHEQHAQQT